MKKIMNKVKRRVNVFLRWCLKNHTPIFVILMFVTIAFVLRGTNKEFLVLGVLIAFEILEECCNIFLDMVDTLPIPKRRYTIKQKNGDIKIRQADIQMAIIYLSSVEDYIERRGLKDE